MATRPASTGRCSASAAPPRVAVAYSGGRDSLALLHATCRAASVLGVQVLAIHIHHGLLPEADGWLRQAQQRCRRWRAQGWPVSLRWARLTGGPAPGQSIEAWARAGRHAALQRLALEAGATLLLLAHHRRDQAETVLLQALRGGGPAGLAAMPPAAPRDGLVWARPWLAQPREAIEAYVRHHRLRPVQDPSNDDLRLARNRLRVLAWPALAAAFPSAEAALAVSARRAHEADAALAELAEADLCGCVGPDGGQGAGALQVAAWRRLSPARQANALRAWLRQQAGRSLPDSLLRRLLDELPPGTAPAAAAGRWPAAGGAELRLYRGRLRWHAVQAADAAPPRPAAMAIDLSQPGWWPVPAWGGVFEVVPAAAVGAEPGLPADTLRQACLRARHGGEQFQRTPAGMARSLKKQYQAAGLPAADRHGPLVWCGERLVWAPGLGPDARAWAPPGARRYRLTWLPDPP